MALAPWKVRLTADGSGTLGAVHATIELVDRAVGTLPLVVAAGDSNVFYVSDGTSWQTLEGPFSSTASIRAVTEGDGTWMAVAGVGGEVATSPDKLNWTRATDLPSNLAGFGVAYGDGRWVVVGYSTTGTTNMAYSDNDGATWTAVTAVSGHEYEDVAYHDGLWVAVGRDGSSFAGRVVTSTDGASWTARTVATTDSLYSVAYGDGLWVTVGSDAIETSSDGTSWTARTVPAIGNGGEFAELVGVAYDGGWAAVGETADGDFYRWGIIVRSGDGTSWSDVDAGLYLPGDRSSALFDVAAAGGRLVAVGSWLTLFETFDGALALRSENGGVSWSQESLPAPPDGKPAIPLRTAGMVA